MDKKQHIKTNQIIDLRQGLYNFILDNPLKGSENENIQYIIEYQGYYGIASLKPLTLQEAESIDFSKYNFKPFKEWEEIWKQNKKVK